MIGTQKNQENKDRLRGLSVYSGVEKLVYLKGGINTKCIKNLQIDSEMSWWQSEIKIITLQTSRHSKNERTILLNETSN